jgi:hypothetical protein
VAKIAQKAEEVENHRGDVSGGVCRRKGALRRMQAERVLKVVKSPPLAVVVEGNQRFGCGTVAMWVRIQGINLDCT